MSAREIDAIETTAAEWLARRDRGFTAEEEKRFADWRAADSRHAAAVAELERVWSALDDLSASHSQQRAGGAAVAPPAQAATVRTGVEAPHRRRSVMQRWWPAWGLAAALAIVASLFWWRQSTGNIQIARYETAVGGIRKVPLPDGTELQLNTDTAVSVRYEKGLRRVKLERGEAFFQVARDPTRPFVVSAGRTEARALGTAFGVRLRERESEVLVAEGRVWFGVMNAAGVTLGANAHAILGLGGDGAPRVEMLETEEIARRQAWQYGRLEFKDTPLSEAVAEFNRYHRQRLVLQGAATETLRMGGAVEIDNQAGFVRLLETSFDIVVIRRASDEIVLGSRL